MKYVASVISVLILIAQVTPAFASGHKDDGGCGAVDAAGKISRCIPPEELPPTPQPPAPSRPTKPVVGPVRDSEAVGKSGVVCTMDGSHLAFRVTEEAVVVRNLETGRRVVYRRSGSEGYNTLVGKGPAGRTHKITIIQMESGVALQIDVQTRTDGIETSADSRLCDLL